MRALSSSPVSRRFFGSAEGSATVRICAEAVADPAVGGQERPLGGGGAGDAEQPPGRGRQLAEQQPGGLGEEQRPVIQGQAQQRGEHGAHRQRPGPPGAVGQRGLDDRGLPAAVDEPGGKRHGLLVRGAARPGDLQPAAHAQHPRRRLSQARKTALGGAPSTWRA